MDTGTHIVMGAAIGTLAIASPELSSATSTAIFTGVLVGSLIPDIDTVLKLKNNAIYIRHHRGITHSIPAVLLWPIIITFLLSLMIPHIAILQVWGWTFFAVFLHVFVDIFNAYGTQALRPFSHKWVALGVINTFDPIIFTLHILALITLAFGVSPVIAIVTLYIILVFYYLLRFAVKSAVKNALAKTVPNATEVIIAPTMRFFQWRIAASSEDFHYVGRAHGRSITIYDRFPRKDLPNFPEMEAAKTDENVKVFMAFSPIYRWEMVKHGELCEVRLIDLRYRTKGYYPFVAVAHVDKDLNIVNSYTGWIFSEEKLNKKLKFIPHS